MAIEKQQCNFVTQGYFMVFQRTVFEFQTNSESLLYLLLTCSSLTVGVHTANISLESGSGK